MISSKIQEASKVLKAEDHLNQELILYVVRRRGFYISAQNEGNFSVIFS